VRPVHRLDRDTSGLMIFALSSRAEQALVAMFKAHEVRRAYLAVVHGRVAEPRTIESWIVRDRGDGLRGSTPRGAADEGAQRAVTHVMPVEHLGDRYTVVECRLETGRTHQIRIHLAEAGHMLCGEKVYTRPAPNAQPVPDRSGAPRQALHSAELEFVHPVTGQTMRFASPLPKDLAPWLDRLRKASV
jgi:23S rRNA pseudouridine1911/1915/1917 synthase